jgi:hypothetical protein
MLIVAFSLLIGLPVGLAAGYFGGWVDEALMRTTDVFLAFPALLLAVLMAAALGPGFLNSIIAVSVTWWPWYARLARAEGLVLRGQPYVEAARLAGVSHPRIILRHILPATARPLTVQAALDVGPALLTAAALSFLGLGVLPPTADWGQMVDAGRKFFPGPLVVFGDAGRHHLHRRAGVQRAGRCAARPQGRGPPVPLPDTTPLLEIRGLSVTIPTPEGDVHAVRAVDLEIGRGDIHGVDRRIR